jgi:hypothetical protein
MLRIEEIVGAMDDEFRYALDVLSDERLAALAADKAALRRLRPVGVSHAEAMAMIAAIQAKRQDARTRQELAEQKKRERAAKRAAAPKTPRKRQAKPHAEPDPKPEPVPAQPCLNAPPQAPCLPSPTSMGPAIRLPPPPMDTLAIPLPPPEQPKQQEQPVTPPTARNPLPTLVIAAGLAAVAVVLWLM